MTRSELQELARSYAREYRIPPAGYVDLITLESNWDPEAVSPAGAAGLAQFMPGTAQDMGVTDRFDPDQSLRGGARYLDYLRSFVLGVDPRIGDDPSQLWECVLASYNWGLGNWRTAYTRDPSGWLCGAPKETREYVDRLLNSFTLEGSATACATPLQRRRSPWIVVAIVLAALVARGQS